MNKGDLVTLYGSIYHIDSIHKRIKLVSRSGTGRTTFVFEEDGYDTNLWEFVEQASTVAQVTLMYNQNGQPVKRKTKKRVDLTRCSPANTHVVNKIETLTKILHNFYDIHDRLAL